MVGTHTLIIEQQVRFKKLLVESLLLPSDSPIIQAFENKTIKTINDVLMLTHSDIDFLEYFKDDKSTDEHHKQTLRLGHRGWIKALISFINYLDLEKEIDIENITYEMFNHYRFKIYNPNANNDSTSKSKETSDAKDIRKRGAKDLLISDREKLKIGQLSSATYIQEDFKEKLEEREKTKAILQEKISSMADFMAKDISSDKEDDSNKFKDNIKSQSVDVNVRRLTKLNATFEKIERNSQI